MKASNISIAITLRNRAEYLDKKLYNLQFQDYDLKKVEICITDGYSTDNLMDVIEKWYRKFYQIKYAISDRSVLPFKLVTNCPACDLNSMICNVATFEKIVKTDAEVLFTSPDALQEISRELDDKDLLFIHKCHCMPEAFTLYTNKIAGNYDRIPFQAQASFAGFSLNFNKSTFIANRGFEEKYVLGFAGEDSYFVHWYRTNKRIKHSANIVLHLWHSMQWAKPEYKKLRKEYTLPLYNKMKAENTLPNIGNADWQRPEMIKDIKIFRDYHVDDTYSS